MLLKIINLKYTISLKNIFALVFTFMAFNMGLSQEIIEDEVVVNKKELDSINAVNSQKSNDSIKSYTAKKVDGVAAVVGDYIAVGDFEGYLHWLDQETGEIISRHHVDGSGIYATPVVSKDILYTQSRDGDLQAIKTP